MDDSALGERESRGDSGREAMAEFVAGLCGLANLGRNWRPGSEERAARHVIGVVRRQRNREFRAALARFHRACRGLEGFADVRFGEDYGLGGMSGRQIARAMAQLGPGSVELATMAIRREGPQALRARARGNGRVGRRPAA